MADYSKEPVQFGDSLPVKVPDKPLIAASIGGGIQSTTMTLMCDKGLITPMPDVGFYSDTGWDPPHVEETIKFLQRTVKNFPIEILYPPTDLKSDTLQAVQNKEFIDIPAFGHDGVLKRQCTTTYKILPMQKRVRELLGRKRLDGPGWVTWYIGISMDEVARMKDCQDVWAENCYPLIDLNMTRSGCKTWMEKNFPGVEVSKSSCAGCPFHNPTEWVELYEKYPKLWEETCEIDKKIRNNKTGYPLFLSRQRKPLTESIKKDLKTVQARRMQGQLWDDAMLDECEGHCGV